ncbi:MAG: hypothetical protein HZC54_19555 [Verrucomicrobia bacterium]|nr:hypothetical protein [Verrucomicrobiota bacterium]
MKGKLMRAAILTALAALGAAAVEAAPPEILDSGLKPETVEQRPYREYVRECLDALISRGTDHYGKTHAPILVSILDVRTRDCPEIPLPVDEKFRVIRRERRGPAGANLYFDQATLRAMLALSRIGGEMRYAEFAEKCMGHWMKHLVDDKGFFWWGWHRHYDVFRDEMTGHMGNPHEIHVQEAMWPELWRVDKGAVRREIEAVWQWHVIDKKTGEVNRHGDGHRGCDFAMSGGEFVRAFAFMHAQTKEPMWLDRARLVADYYWKARDPKTSLIPNRPNAGTNRFDGSHFETSISGLMCHSLLGAAELSGEAKFREQAVVYLKAGARYGYDAQAGRFWGSLKLDGSPEPGPRVRGGYAQYEPRGHMDLWQPYAAGYEHPLYAAQAYAQAYKLTRDEALLETAQRWAGCIRRAFPPRACETGTWYQSYATDWAPHGTYAQLYGQTISFFLQMHRLTGDAAHLQFARDVAKESLCRLYYRGLLRGHSCKPYYEAIDGVGYLLYALLQLDQTLAGNKDALPLENW